MAEQQIQLPEVQRLRSTKLAGPFDIADALGVTFALHAGLKPSAHLSLTARHRRICTIHVPTQR